MKRYHDEEGIPTLAAALSEYMNTDDLKKLATLGKSTPVGGRCHFCYSYFQRF